MKKLLFLNLLLFLCVIAVSAQDKQKIKKSDKILIPNKSEIKSTASNNDGEWLGYYHGDFNDLKGLGVSSACTYNCAIQLEAGDSYLFGKQLRAMRFALRSLKNIEDVKVWVSTTLPQTVEDADICHMQLNKSELYDIVNDGKVNDVFFEKPYQFLRQNVFVGYSFTITYCESDDENYPIIVAGEDSYLYTMYISINDEQWYNYPGQKLGVLAMKVYVDDNASYVMGDVNYDNIVDITDVSSLVKYVSGREIQTFNKKAADIDKNGSINIVDVASDVDILLDKYGYVSDIKKEENKDVLSAIKTSDGYSMYLNGEERYKAFQIDVKLPEGSGIEDIVLGNNILSTHSVECTKISDERYRIAVFSLGGEDFSSDENLLLSFKTNSVSAEIDNIIFATSDLCEKRFESIRNSDITGIEEIKIEEISTDIYSVYGVKLDSARENLSSGVYIINGKKVIIK